MTIQSVELIENPCTLIVPPNYMALISGVRFARLFPSGECELEYTDGTKESATLTREQVVAQTSDDADFFSLVSTVQKIARAQ